MNTIPRRDFLIGTTGVLGAAWLGGGALAAGRPPNIVLILIDDMGWKDAGCCGSAVFETPNVDRLATEGMRFTQAYANCPVCSPSRAALMTGKNPARLGFTSHITAIGRHRHPEGSRLLPPDDRLQLPLSEVTIADALKPAGFVSASVGKWHLGPEGFWPEDQGFDVNIGGWTHGSPPSYFYPYKDPEKDWNPSIPTLQGGEPGEYLTDRLTSEGMTFIRKNRDRPFFLYMTHYAVHTPLQAPDPLIDKYREKLAGRDTGIDPVYAAMIENMDTNVGRLLDTLDETGCRDNTLVILTSDNGGLARVTDNTPLRAGKGSLYEGGIRVPMIVRWPGQVAPGTTCSEPVIGSDLYPTILDAIESAWKPAKPLDGVSIAPLWRGADHVERAPLFWYYPHYHSESMRPGAAIRMTDYKLIETYDPPGVELFNLADDPSEQNNLAEAMPERTTSMLAELHAYLDRVNAVRPTPNPNWDGKSGEDHKE